MDYSLAYKKKNHVRTKKEDQFSAQTGTPPGPNSLQAGEEDAMKVVLFPLLLSVQTCEWRLAGLRELYFGVLALWPREVWCVPVGCADSAELTVR